jgi:hypothetical protein
LDLASAVASVEVMCWLGNILKGLGPRFCGRCADGDKRHGKHPRGYVRVINPREAKCFCDRHHRGPDHWGNHTEVLCFALHTTLDDSHKVAATVFIRHKRVDRRELVLDFAHSHSEQKLGCGLSESLFDRRGEAGVGQSLRVRGICFKMDVGEGGDGSGQSFHRRGQWRSGTKSEGRQVAIQHFFPLVLSKVLFQAKGGAGLGKDVGNVIAGGVRSGNLQEIEQGATRIQNVVEGEMGVHDNESLSSCVPLV